MAGHGNFHAAAESSAVNGHHNGLAAILDLQKKGKQPGSAWLSRSHLREFLDIGTRNESASASDEHSGSQAVVLLQLIDGFRNSFRNAGAQRVHRWIVYGDDTDFT